MDEKHVSDSLTEQIHIVMPGHINGAGRLFGGKLVEWIDVVAAVTARRHSGYIVTTAAIDNLQFKAGAFVNDTIFMTGRVTYVGKTSMEVRVDSYTEGLDGMRRPINRAYLVMVAIDHNQKTAEVPRLIIETENEEMEWNAAIRRNQLRNQRRKEGY